MFSSHLTPWFKVFIWNDIYIVKGDEVIKSPAKEMAKVVLSALVVTNLVSAGILFPGFGSKLGMGQPVLLFITIPWIRSNWTKIKLLGK